jgi:hypothetical protein
MGLIAPLLALLGIEAESLIARARTSAIIYAVTAIFLMAACIFACLAGYLALAEIFGGIVAAVIMAGGFLLLALAVFAGSRIGQSRRQREVAERRRSSETGAFVTTAAITALPMLMRSPTLLKLGIPAAAIAALAVLRNKKDKP